MYAYPLAALVAIVLAVYFVRVSSPEPGGRWERVVRRARWWLGIASALAVVACSSGSPESSSGSISGNDAGAPCVSAADCPASTLDGTVCAYIVCVAGACGIAPEPSGDGCLSNACGAPAMGTCDGMVARCDVTCPDAGATCATINDCDPALLSGTVCMGLACDTMGRMTDPRSKVPGCYIEPVNILTPCPMANGCTGFCETPDAGGSLACVLPTGSTCGSVTCAVPSDCPASLLSGSECKMLTCESGHCGVAPSPAGTSCLSFACGIGTCDGASICNACVTKDGGA